MTCPPQAQAIVQFGPMAPEVVAIPLATTGVVPQCGYNTANLGDLIMFPAPRPAALLIGLLLIAPASAQAPDAKESFAAAMRSVAVVLTPERTATAVVVDA